MASNSETKALMKEYSDLKRLIDSHKKAASLGGPIGTETQSLLKEYTDLKRLIDAHKQSSGFQGPPFRRSTLKPVPLQKFNHFSRRPNSSYALNRTKSQFPPITVLTSASANNYRLSNGPQRQFHHPTGSKPTTSASKNAPPFEIIPQIVKTTPRKQDISVASFKPPKNVTPLKKTQSKYKLIKQNNSKITSLKPRIQSPSQSRRLQSKYKFVMNAKQNPSKEKVPKSPLAAKSKKSSNRSKYSWTSNCSPTQKCSSGQPVKTRFILSKAARKKSPGVSPRLVRRVNKYSVKYVQQRQKPPSIKPTRKGSDLVVIGGMLYKSSKTKLSRTVSSKISTLKSSGSSTAKQRIVTVRGVRFAMDLNRKVLQRLPTIDEQSPAVTSPELKKSASVMSFTQRRLTRIDIGGETYIQTRPGVLVRSLTNQLRNLANRVINRSLFRLRASAEKKQQYCLFYNKFGKCNNKEKGTCPYIHDPDKIAVCKRFLRGECAVERCPFAHTKCRAKMPVCTFFLRGRCNNDSCNYRHVNVNPKADICLDFAKGYCPLGEECKKWHTSVCPQFELTGSCDKADKCPLKHRQRVAKPPKRRVDELAATSLPDGIACMADTAEPLTKTRCLPSFISLLSDSEGCSSDTVQKDVPLQIKPTFMMQD